MHLFLIPDPCFHFPVLLESYWTTPWLESVLKIVHSLGGPHTCVAVPSGEAALLLLPSICTQRTQLKPEGGREGSLGARTPGALGVSLGSLGPGWACSCFVSVSMSF